jgi:integrase
LKLIRSVYEYAIDCDYVTTNPTRGIRDPVPHAHPEGKQNRPPTNEELRLIWTLAPQHIALPNVQILRLLLLLGKRVSEIIGIRRTEAQLTGDAHLFIPGEREGNKSREDQRVPLPSLAVEILRTAMSSHVSPLVFPQDGDATKSIGRTAASRAFTELRRAIGISDNVRLHDARGLLVDQLAAMGVP